MITAIGTKNYGYTGMDGGVKYYGNTGMGLCTMVIVEGV